MLNKMSFVEATTKSLELLKSCEGLSNEDFQHRKFNDYGYCLGLNSKTGVIKLLKINIQGRRSKITDSLTFSEDSIYGYGYVCFTRKTANGNSTYYIGSTRQNICIGQIVRGDAYIIFDLMPHLNDPGYYNILTKHHSTSIPLAVNIGHTLNRSYAMFSNRTNVILNTALDRLAVTEEMLINVLNNQNRLAYHKYYSFEEIIEIFKKTKNANLAISKSIAVVGAPNLMALFIYWHNICIGVYNVHTNKLKMALATEFLKESVDPYFQTAEILR